MTERTATPVFSITPFTLLDYPDHTACILWFAGCNMRCAYCYNPEIVEGKGKISLQEINGFLRRRLNLLDGVVLSGGECTLHPELPSWVKEIKGLGMKVKIDTNGSRPEVIKRMADDGLLDYVALDFKALPPSYRSITGSDLFYTFEQTLVLLTERDIPFEVRTTLHSHLHKAEDLGKMIEFLEQKSYRGVLYLQHFVGEKKTLQPLPESKKHEFAGIESPHMQIIWRN